MNYSTGLARLAAVCGVCARLGCGEWLGCCWRHCWCAVEWLSVHETWNDMPQWKYKFAVFYVKSWQKINEWWEREKKFKKISVLHSLSSRGSLLVPISGSVPKVKQLDHQTSRMACCGEHQTNRIVYWAPNLLRDESGGIFQVSSDKRNLILWVHGPENETYFIVIFKLHSFLQDLNDVVKKEVDLCFLRCWLVWDSVQSSLACLDRIDALPLKQWDTAPKPKKYSRCTMRRVVKAVLCPTKFNIFESDEVTQIMKLKR